MIKLEPFTQQDFDSFKSWVANKEELFQFAGPLLNFPLTNAQLENYLNNEYLKPHKVVLIATNQAIGHCELNFTNGNNRLSRILIGDKSLRGKKIGEQVVRKMVDLFFENEEINEVDLNTFDWNTAAIRCYEKVGFKINENASESMQIFGFDWTKINMVLKRRDYRFCEERT